MGKYRDNTLNFVIGIFFFSIIYISIVQYFSLKYNISLSLYIISIIIIGIINIIRNDQTWSSEINLHKSNCAHHLIYDGKHPYKCYSDSSLMIQCDNPVVYGYCHPVHKSTYCNFHWKQKCRNMEWSPGLSGCLNEYLDTVEKFKNETLSAMNKNKMTVKEISKYLDEIGNEAIIREHIY